MAGVFGTLQSDERTFDVVVVGGGFSGCVIAAALARPGRRILVVEAKPGAVHRRLAGELMHPAGAAVLEKLGLLEPLHRAGAIDVHGFAVYPGVPDEDPTLLGYDEMRGLTLPGLAIPHDVLVETLRGVAASRPGVRLCEARVEQVLTSQGRVFGVRVADRAGRARDVYATLVVAADGRHSKTRQRLGLEPTSTRISYSGGATIPASALPHARHGHIFLGAWGPVLAYPISATTARMVFDLPPDFSEGRRDRLARHLLERYVPSLPASFRPAVQAAMERPVDLQVAPNYRRAVARSFVPGAVLLGDANGCMHPMTAGGMTNGLSDVRHLVPAAHAYLEAGGRDDAPLARYDRDRRPFFETRALLARALYEVFRSEDRGARALRDGVFRAWETSPDFRSQTLSLLGGDATSPTAFAQQYIRVVARAMGRTVRLGQGDGRLRTLLDIGRQSVVHLDPGVLSRMVSPARLLRTAA